MIGEKWLEMLYAKRCVADTRCLWYCKGVSDSQPGIKSLTITDATQIFVELFFTEFVDLDPRNMCLSTEAN